MRPGRWNPNSPKCTRNQTKIMHVLADMGSGTYDEIMARYRAVWGPDDQSSEGIARRGRELAEKGQFIDTGKRAPGDRIIWTTQEDS